MSSTISKEDRLRALTRSDIAEYIRTVAKTDPNRAQAYLNQLFTEPLTLRLFAWLCFGDYIKLQTPEFHDQIWQELARLEDPDTPKRIGIGAPRGHAKTTIVDLIWCAWLIVNKKRNFIVMISDTYAQSVEFVNALKDQLDTNPYIKFLYGDLRSDYWRDGEFVTSSNVKVVAKGVGMKIRGLRHKQYRPDLVICDDIENDEQVRSQDQRKKLKRWMLDAVLPAMSRDGWFVIIGTILHFDSLLANILAGNDPFLSWSRLIFQAIVTDEDGTNHALWEAHTSLEQLLRMRDDPAYEKYVGKLTFEREYMNRPFSEADAIIKPDYVRWCDMPDESQIVVKMFAVDPAISKRDTADYTGKIVAGKDKEDNVYVFYVSRDRMSFLENVEDIKRVDELYKPRKVGIEKVAFQAAFQEVLKGLPVVELKPDADKIRRLLSVSRHFQAGKIFFVNGTPHIQDLYHELLEFPDGVHDDLVDALVYAIGMLIMPLPRPTIRRIG